MILPCRFRSRRIARLPTTLIPCALAVVLARLSSASSIAPVAAASAIAAHSPAPRPAGSGLLQPGAVRTWRCPLSSARITANAPGRLGTWVHSARTSAGTRTGSKISATSRRSPLPPSMIRGDASATIIPVSGKPDGSLTRRGAVRVPRPVHWPSSRSPKLRWHPGESRIVPVTDRQVLQPAKG